jgi:hypothetical protein
VALFAAASIVVIYLLPRAGKFRFEYAKGRPWKHGVLITNFDFPIYKTADELKSEKDSALKFFKPYFIHNQEVWTNEVTQFGQDFSSTYIELRKDFPFLSSYLRGPGTNSYNALQVFLKRKLNHVYTSGVVQLPDNYNDVPLSFQFKLVKGNFAEPYGLSEVYTAKSAYRKVAGDLFDFLNDSIRFSTKPNAEQINSLISSLQLNRYITPNITFDKPRTDTEKQELLKNVSLTSGAMKAGQRIIATGEMVDDKMLKILDSYRQTYENRLGIDSGYSQILIGQILIVFAFFTMVYLFLFFFRHDVFVNNKSILFILLTMVSMILMARISRSFFYVPIYIIPFAILPIAIRIFFDSRLALFIHILTILLSSFFAENSFQFIFLQIPIGITSIFGLFKLMRRSQLIRATFYIVFVYSLLYTALFLWQEGDIKKIEILTYGKFALNGALILLIYPAIYLIEKLFGFLSDVTLVELSDTNHPLLRKLAEKSPGTFQHSIQVGNLAQEAVYQIGGNPALVRAGAMYHDIGKMEAPLLFTENQISGFNPHNELELEESAQLVISHIENGVKLARKHQLPEQIIDFIRTHQGTTRTKYFYNTFVNKYPNSIPDVSLFTYPGPTPFTKETAVLMMADAVEAASRSLSNFSDNEIDKLVENIVNDQIEQGQFINAPITFKEVTEVKEIFKRRLTIIYHARVKYPELKSKKKKL